MKKVLIATPSHEGTVCCDYAVAMAETFRQNKNYDYELQLQFWMYQSLVQKARNSLLAKAYKNDYDEMVWIDADQGFKAEDFYRLLEHPVDAVAFPVRMKTEEDQYNIRPHDPAAHDWDDELKLLEVRAIGTGFLRLSKKAIRILWDAGEPYKQDGEEVRMICNLEIRNGGIIGEDIQICERLQNAGIKIYADIESTCDHFGTKRFRGDYVQYCFDQVKAKEKDKEKEKHALNSGRLKESLGDRLSNRLGNRLGAT